MVRAQGIDSALKALEWMRRGGGHLAWLNRNGVLKYARSPERQATGARAFHSGADSAVVSLIEGVYATEPRWAFAWLRNRILTTEAAGVASDATVRVAARKAAWSRPPAEFEAVILQGGFSLIEEVASEKWQASLASEELEPVTARLCWADEGGVLVDRVNQARTIRTRHAEVLVVRQWLDEGDWGIETKRLRLEVSLKCCKMCAAWVFEAFAGRHDFEVVFKKWDPGKLARFTVLEEKTPQRIQAVNRLGLGPEWIQKVLERPLSSGARVS
ncbi:MAG: Bd3614 family nucleic acid deaminase [Oligoflexia bacterium]